LGRELTSERYAVSVTGEVAVAPAEGRLLSELVIDAAVVDEVEDSVPTANDSFPISKQIIGKA